MSEFTGKNKLLFHLKNLREPYIDKGGYRAGDLEDLRKLIDDIVTNKLIVTDSTIDSIQNAELIKYEKMWREVVEQKDEYATLLADLRDKLVEMDI